MTNDAFIGKAIGVMIANNVTVRFNKRTYVSKYSCPYFTPPPHSEFIINYFDKEQPDEWIHTFIHEYAHFLQWLLENDKWKPYDKYSSSLNEFFENPERQRVSSKCIHKVQEIEVDGGLKVAELIRQHRLQIDKKRYFIDNNLYILCHEAMVKYRKFDIPYAFTGPIMKYIPSRPITVATLESFKHFDKIEQAYEQAYGSSSL